MRFVYANLVMNKILNQIGIKTKLKNDSIKIFGNPNINLNKSYKIETHFDHRICMTSFIIGQIFGGKIEIKDCDSINTSFPKFLTIMKFNANVWKHLKKERK